MATRLKILLKLECWPPAPLPARSEGRADTPGEGLGFEIIEIMWGRTKQVIIPSSFKLFINIFYL